MGDVLDREARFRRLCETHTAELTAYALRRVPQQDAADVVAETFLVAWRRLDEIDAERSALPWLYAVARRVLLSQRRASGRQQAIAQRVADAERALPLHAEGAPPGSRRLLEALADLSESEREVLMLVAWEDLSSSEAARALGCSATAFRIRLHRARKHLRERLSQPHADEQTWAPPSSARTKESASC